MKPRIVLIAIFSIIFVIFCFSDLNIIEGMKNCGGKARHGGRGGKGRAMRRRHVNRGSPGWFGHGYFRHRPPAVRRNIQKWRRGGSTTIYDGVPYYWAGYRERPHPTIYNYYPSLLYSGSCRRGCGFVGNGVMGCINPTNLPDSCIFASDCYGC